MNKFAALLFLIMVPTLPQMCSPRRVLKLRGNMFQKLNALLQTIYSSIFTTLKLNKNFTLDYKHRLLLSMHASMKSIVEENYKLYKSIKRICRLNATKRPTEGLFNLDKLIDVILDDRLKPSMDNSKNKTKRSGLKLKITSLEIPEKSEESIVFLREYLNNVENMELVGFETPSQRIKEIYEKNAKIRVIKRKNLKAWRLPNGTELTQHPNRRLFLGVNTKIKRFPFIVSIHVMGDFVCTGSVISAEMVITAATCLQIAFSNPNILTVNKKSILARVGSEFTDKSGELCEIEKIYFHPSYDPITLRNNLAIMRLKKHLNFRQKHKKIRRIEYMKEGDNSLKTAKMIMLLGWGEKEDQTSEPTPLSYSNLNMYSKDKCKTIYSNVYVSDMNYCAGYSSQGSGACQRDIGGPAIINSTLVGVVSFGPIVCGTPDAPTVFTDIGYYTTWIDSVIKVIPSKKKPKLRLPGKRLAKLKTKIEKQLMKLKPQLLMQMRSAKGNKKHIKNRAVEYPQAVQVISYLLNKLIGGKLRLDPDDYNSLMGISDSSNEDKNDTDDTKVTTQATEKLTSEQVTAIKKFLKINDLRENPDTNPVTDPEPLSDERNVKITTPLSNKDEENLPDGTRQDTEKNSTTNENIQFENFSGFTEGLIIGAIQILRDYLGFNISVSPVEETADNSAMLLDSADDPLGKSNKKYLNNMMSGEPADNTGEEIGLREGYKHSDSSYERDVSTYDQGMSIELPLESPNEPLPVPSYPTLTFSRRPTTAKEAKLASEDKLPEIKDLEDLMSQEEEKKFLSQNFMPETTPNLVVLVLQDESSPQPQLKHKMKTTKKPMSYNDFGLLATQFMSDDEERKTVTNSDEEVTEASTVRHFRHSKHKITENPGDYDEDYSTNARRNILDYINIT